MANNNTEISAKLAEIEQRINRLESSLIEQITRTYQGALTSVKEALSSEISQINGNVVTLGNNITTTVTREVSETKRVLSEGFTEQRNKLSTLPEMQSAVTQAVTSCQVAISESVGELRSYVEEKTSSMNNKIENLSESIQTVKSELATALSHVKEEILAEGEEIVTKCDDLRVTVGKAEELTRSLFVAYSNMIGEISRLATEAASNFAKDLLLANELRDAVQNCEVIIDIFNDLKGTYKTIAEIAAEGLKLFNGEGSMRQVFGKIEAAKDVSFALSSLTNVFRAFKQESRESRFDF